MSRHIRVGRLGEETAAGHLASKGYRVLATNYRHRRAEIDIVAFLPSARSWEGGQVVFVEVKTRSGIGYGYPEEAVNDAKQKNLIRAARAWLRENRMERVASRFDVIGIVISPDGMPDIRHIENAFWTY